jgi:hypothetical protein
VQRRLALIASHTGADARTSDIRAGRARAALCIDQQLSVQLGRTSMAWGTQRNWRWCSKCQGLWFGGNPAGPCPAGGKHSKTGSGNYSLVHQATSAPGQANWRWCKKCQGLWFGGNPAGPCPAGGKHSKTGSGNYTIAHQTGAGQQGWRWCNKCQGMWFSQGNPSKCPAGGAHSQTGSGSYRLVIVTQRVRIHTKILTPPNISIDTLMHNMREVYATANCDVEWVSTESLNFPALNDLDVGACVMGATTAEQNALYANRNNAGANDIVVYFVRSTVPPFNGCAAHPAGRPAACVVQTATQWTFAHEVGHVLGLFHVNNNDRLMTGNGTANITNAPPDLVAGEVTTMTNSALTANV